MNNTNPNPDTVILIRIIGAGVSLFKILICN